jgi:short-subunit dehydrogenase
MKKVVLITGTSSGLGLALAIFLHQKGYHVYGTSRKPTATMPWNMLQMDVTDGNSITSAVDAILQQEGQIDILINNAGIGLAGPMEHLELTNIQRVFDTNVFGVVRMCKAVLPAMRKQGAGRIINIGSIGGEMGLPFRGLYSATKAALALATDALRHEVSDFGIQCCTVLAGDLATAINDHRIKDWKPEDEGYSARFEQAYAAMDKNVEKGLSANKAAQRIENLLHVKRLRNRYAIGTPMQELAVLLNKLLPSPWVEWLISQYGKK